MHLRGIWCDNSTIRIGYGDMGTWAKMEYPCILDQDVIERGKA